MLRQGTEVPGLCYWSKVLNTAPVTAKGNTYRWQERRKEEEADSQENINGEVQGYLT